MVAELRPIMKKIFYEAIIVIFLSVSLALVVNILRYQGLHLFTSGPARPAKTNETNSSPQVKEISIKNALAKFKAKTALFIDSRSPEAFLEGHIKGALNLPEPRFNEWIEEFILKTNPKTEIITYCGGSNCPLARNLAEKLFLAGFENVSYLDEGFDKWEIISK